MEWKAIVQDDFSGGINWMDSPVNLNDNEIADCRNVRLTTKKSLTRRDGFVKYNSSAIGSVEVKKIYHFRDYTGNLIPVVQAGNNLYKGSSAFPNTGSFTQIHAGSSGTSYGFLDAMWGKLIYTNGVDVPQVWEGNYGKCYGFKKTTDSGATFVDYTQQVSDEDSSTYASLGSMASTHYVVVGSRVPKVKGIRFVISTPNTNTATMTVAYWNGSSWTTVSNISDGTAVSGKTLAQTGDVTFNECTIALSTIDKSRGYFLRITVSATLSSTVNISAVYLIYDMQPLPSFWDGKTIKPDGFKVTFDGSTYKDYTSYVTDDSLSTVASLGGLSTSGYFYVQSVKKIRGIRIKMSTTNVNTNTATLSCSYWDGGFWQSLTLSDSTAVGGATLAQSGEITWTWPTAAQKRSIGNDTDTFYQFRFAVSGTLSNNVDIAEVECLPEIDPLRPHQLLLYHKNRAFLANRADAKNYIFYSAQFLPDVWEGDDAGYIGVPSGREIMAMCRFYNDLFIGTPDEIYILQGYTPQTFGLLKINTGGVGVVAPHSVVPVGKYIYFLHSTGFYRFDGIGVVYISGKIQKLFDKTDSAAIPDDMLSKVQGRFDRVNNCVEWIVRSGSGTQNNLKLIFDINSESWYVDTFTASAIATVSDAYSRDLQYHGDYSGYVYRDNYGNTDDGSTINAYIQTRVYTIKESPVLDYVFRGMTSRFDTEDSGSVTVSAATSGYTTFTNVDTVNLVKSGYNFVEKEYHCSMFCNGVALKFSSSNEFTLTRIETRLVPVRGMGLNR